MPNARFMERESGRNQSPIHTIGGVLPGSQLNGLSFRRHAPTLVGLTLSLIVFVLLFLFDPAQHGFYPGCTLYKMTGLYCPGCGGLRAAHQLLHGRIGAAFHFNPLFVGGLPLVLWVLARATFRHLRDQPLFPAMKLGWLWIGVTIVVVFTVVYIIGR